MGTGLFFAWEPARTYLRQRNQPKFRFGEVRKGTYSGTVTATGEIKPVHAVSVGATISGPIIELHADFNDRVEKGDLLAVIDPRIYQAIASADEATLANRRADLERSRVLLEQAQRDLKRAKALQTQGDGFISPTEMDQRVYSEKSQAAQVKIGEAMVRQAEAALENSRANLGYTRIVAPVSGIVIDRKIDLGQTLAAQFQTPELFVIAPQMEQTMHIYASIDEADIGRIREAQQSSQPVTFRVDAYPDDVFQGTIKEIRFRSTTTQNVVTYPVVVSTANPDLKLLPGMTANLTFQIRIRENATMVPNASLRFFPKLDWVRESDQVLIKGSDQIETQTTQEGSVLRRKRHVWFWEEQQLKAIEVLAGESDHRFTEILDGDLKPGQKLVIGLEPK
jgi:HlyD family secretion protein